MDRAEKLALHMCFFMTGVISLLLLGLSYILGGLLVNEMYLTHPRLSYAVIYSFIAMTFYAYGYGIERFCRMDDFPKSGSAKTSYSKEGNLIILPKKQNTYFILFAKSGMRIVVGLMGLGYGYWFYQWQLNHDSFLDMALAFTLSYLLGLATFKIMSFSFKYTYSNSSVIPKPLKSHRTLA